MNRKKLVFGLLKNRQVRRIGLKLLEDPRVRRMIFKRVSRRLGRRR